MTQTIAVPDGSIVWKMGMKWGILSPDDNGEYQQDNIQYTENPPLGIVDKYFGRGSFKKSLQLIGRPPQDKSVEISLGWVNVNINIIDGIISTSINNASKAARKRWDNPDSRIPKPKVNNKHIPIPFNVSPIPPIEDLRLKYEAKEITDHALWEWLRSIIYVRDKGICWVCNNFVLLGDYHLGHLVDKSNNGEASLDNCAVMHKRCNSSKPSHHTLEEALIWRLNREP